MFQWTTVFQSLMIWLLIAVIGGLWAMYIRVLGHSDKILQLQKDVAEQGGKQDGLDKRLQAIEITSARIDENVKELLRTQRSESSGRLHP